ncbi:phospholipase D family protein [Protaetiibacter mangrovi]|uniref:Phospholipase D family protein n=1 Tax=Protaetiibacter mangrovi TaxID=2970926 RepID=A0ABT1ZEQ8_9MICO|nr:phospholipase D family protein [Protaetiibacter mangrovi]MCS0499194.1 phospholipase D family protein [Protaetiibacter mangrovi]TPX02448.1 hypothetical protein FJ656_22325 [Schumannella luteola]
MLEPQSRATLTDQLRPPTGFELVHAVGTTFTLDLTTALSVPLSFAAHRATDPRDPIGVLDAVRRVADRIDLFAQAGAMSMGVRSDLVAFLEDMVHPVAVDHGLFHPKVWLLEYRAGDESRFRFVCASRNLTSDPSWDIVLRLDGWFADDRYREHAATVSAPLETFLKALPGMALHVVDDARRDRIFDLAARTVSIAWETPDDMRDLAFHPLGTPGASAPDVKGKRALIISPFVSDDGLKSLRSGVRVETHLISRAESLDRLAPASFDQRMTTYILDDAAAQLGDESGTESFVPVGERLVGLHAKAVILDRADGAHVLLGSANATDAAWNGNVEFLVELVGSQNRFGVQATLDALGELKEEYPAGGGEAVDPEEEATRRLESELRRIATIPLWVRVLEGEPHSLRVWAGEKFASAGRRLADRGLSLRWHLLTRPDVGSDALRSGEANGVEVGGIPLTDVTPFLVLVLTDAEGRSCSSIQLAQLLDDIDTRRDAIVARQLTDRAAFIRLLTLMLELSGIGIGPGMASAGATGFFGTTAGASGAGLFEALIRAVGEGRSGLAEVRRIVDFMRSQSDPGDILPQGFDELWERAWAAHLELGGTA